MRIIRRLFVLALVLAVVGLAAFWVLTIPRSVAAGDLIPHKPDVANGERMFWAIDPFGNPISFVDEKTVFMGF